MVDNLILKGSIVALVTPMKPSGALDREAFDALIEWHVEQGTHGVVIAGTTGESATLDMAEHCTLIAQAVRTAQGRIPVIAGTGANSTEEALYLTAKAAEAGADACLLVTPYYNKPTQAGLVAHYTRIADTVEIPQILYNVPGRTACDLLPETVAILASHPNITGIKEASDLHRIDSLCALGDDFFVLSGDDAQNYAIMMKGAVGVISVTANVAPALMSDFCTAMLTGATDRAAVLHERLLSLHRALFVESNPIPVKWALHEMGHVDHGIRLPLTPLASSLRPALAATLRDMELL